MDTYIFRFKNGTGKQVEGKFISNFEAWNYARELAEKNKVRILFIKNEVGEIYWCEVGW